MARYLRQSTALNSGVTPGIKLGPFVSPTDGITTYTSAIAYASVKLSKNGNALASKANTTNTSHDADGYHLVPLDSGDVDTVGRLRLEVAGSAGNYLPVWDDFVVLSQALFDWLFGATAPSTTTPPTAAAIATAVLTDATDTATAGSLG